MPVDRIKRVNELLRREIAGALFQILTEPGVDMAAIMITHVSASRNLRTAHVGVSIRDHKGEEKQMLSLLKKHRQEIQERINKNLFLKYTPKLSFHLDRSVEKGDKVLNLLANMEEEAPEAPLELSEEE